MSGADGRRSGSNLQFGFGFFFLLILTTAIKYRLRYGISLRLGNSLDIGMTDAWTRLPYDI